MTVLTAQTVCTGVCRTCGRTIRLRLAGTLHSWTCTNCGTTNAISGGATDAGPRVEPSDVVRLTVNGDEFDADERDVTRVPVSGGESPSRDVDPSIH